MLNQKAYALVLVLATLLMASLVGGFFLKRSEQRAELSQLNLSERALRVRVASVFNQVAEQFRAYIEGRVGMTGEVGPLTGNLVCPPTDQSLCFDVSDVDQPGLQSVNIRCLSQGAGASYTTSCDTDEIFPKTFMMEIQIRSLEKQAVSLSASGEMMYAPTPLNAYSRATAGITTVTTMRDAEYKGNVALNFCAPNVTMTLRPSARPTNTPDASGLGKLSFSQPIITNRISALQFDTSAAGSSITYPGVREIGLDGILNAFRAGMESAITSSENQTVDVRAELLNPGLLSPEELEVTCTQPNGAPTVLTVPYTLEASCDFTGASNPRFWLSGSDFRAEAQRLCSGSLFVEAGPCRGLTFPDGSSLIDQLGLVGDWQVSCQQLPGNRPDSLQLNCGFSRESHPRSFTRSIGVGTSESNIFVFSQMPQVDFDQVIIFTASATANRPFAIYVPDGRVNLRRAFKWTGDSTRLGGSFFARDGFFMSRDTFDDNGSVFNTDSDFSFEATLVALEGPPPPAIEIGVFTPSEGLPTSFDNGDLFRAVQPGSVSGLNFQPATTSVHFCAEDLIERVGELWVKRRRPATFDLGDLLENQNGFLKLGTLKLKGGVIGSEPNTLRLSETINNVFQVVAGFQNVESEFLPNDSPPLIQRVFVSDLMTTVLNLNIHISDPRAAMDEVGLTWEAPQPDD